MRIALNAVLAGLPARILILIGNFPAEGSEWNIGNDVAS